VVGAYPKIFAIGTDYIKDIFTQPVEVTEKVDGSMVAFGKTEDGTLFARSKGKQLILEYPEKMFTDAVEYIKIISDKIPLNHAFYCEYLRKPKHNALAYNTIPKNNLVLFGVYKIKEHSFYPIGLQKFANLLDIDRAPVIYRGMINNADELLNFLELESYLGGPRVEGVVVKNYNLPFLLGGQPIPLMAGKFVSEKFKEVHSRTWKGEHSSKGKWETFLESYRTEARWDKAIQHLREKGELENSPRDIGPLIKEIQRDIEEEERDNILNFLWKEFGTQVLRKSIAGFPEYFKEKLLKESFNV